MIFHHGQHFSYNLNCILNCFSSSVNAFVNEEFQIHVTEPSWFKVGQKDIVIDIERKRGQQT